MIQTIRMIIDGRRGIFLNRATAYACLELLLSQVPYVLLYLALTRLFAPEQTVGHTRESLVLWPWLIVVLLAFAAQAACSILSQRDTQIGGASVMRDVRLRLGEHLRKLPMGYFYRKNQGEISQALLASVDELELLLTHLFNQMAASAVLVIVSAGLLAAIDWRLTVAVLITVPLSLPLLYMSQRIMDRASKKRHDAAAVVNGRLLEYIQNIRLLKAHNMTGERFGRLADALARFRDDSIRMEALSSPVLGLFGAVLEAGFVLLLLLGNMLMLGGKLDVSVCLSFLIVSLRFYQPLRAIGVSLMQLRFMANAGERIRACLVEPMLPEPAFSKLSYGYDVEFAHVSFGYGEQPVLRDVSFRVPQKGMVALVGPSGAGKSTVAQLIARFWDVDAGAVRIGGLDVREMKTEHVLASVSMVFQDVHLFNDTILANIRVGNPQATLAQVMEAAKAANCHAFIESLPDGYDTMVGEGGAALSGGEKQRISIARAILKDAPIVLLDEPTASLDPENEWHVQRAIERLASEKTVIVIAHRLKTIRAADRILVLQHGTIVEQGSHDELLEKRGLYRELWEEQRKAGGWKLRKQERQGSEAHAL